MYRRDRFFAPQQLFNPPPVRSAPTAFQATPPTALTPIDSWYGLPLFYRPIEYWQELARNGSLRPEDLLFDAGSREWRSASEYDALRAFFPPAIDWGQLLRVGLAVGLGAWGLKTLTEGLFDGQAQVSSWTVARREVFRRDDYTCTYCGHRGDGRTLEVDHRTPLSRGGGDEMSNLVTACWPCNAQKGARTEWEYRLSTFFRS